MLKQVLARLAFILGLPLLVVSYVPLNNQLSIQTNNPPQNQDSLKVVVPDNQVFAKIKLLAEQKKYMKAVEALKNIPSTNPQYKQAQELKWQFQQKIIVTLGACANGFDSTALNRSSFYKVTNGKYIAQIECYLSASQPAYEYYLYTEPPTNTEIKPLNLTQFELDYRRISQLESNFVTGTPEFNKQTQQLLMLQKYGAIDDCGTLGIYKFGQDKFILKQFFADFKCGDRKLQYQKIYPTNVKIKSDRANLNNLHKNYSLS